jgi:hypothetical protein
MRRIGYTFKAGVLTGGDYFFFSGEGLLVNVQDGETTVFQIEVIADAFDISANKISGVQFWAGPDAPLAQEFYKFFPGKVSCRVLL